MTVVRLLIVALVVSLVLGTSVSSAQDRRAPEGPTGHWEGTIRSPLGETSVKIDLDRDAQGRWVGTFANPGEQLRDFPLSAITADGRAVTFEIRPTSGRGTFVGRIADDGATMSGNYRQSVYAVPFSLRRTGDARISPPPRSAAIGRELEGTWNGTLDAGGRELHVRVTLANQPDGSSTGNLVIVEQELEVPLAVTHRDAAVTFDMRALGQFAGTLDASRWEIAGSLTTGKATLPLRLQRQTTSEARLPPASMPH